MKWEDLTIDQKVWRAVIIDGIDGKDRLFVTEYEVKMLGKTRFRLEGKRQRIQGMYVNNRELFEDLQSSPAAAVAQLAGRLARDSHEAEEAFHRTIVRIQEHETLVKDWYNKAGL
jgi:hypothetical protein